MSQPLGVTLEETNALQDAQDIINERGSDIILYRNDEEDVTRDIYGSIKARVPSSLTLHAWPIKRNPSIYEVREAGISEGVDVMITLATKDFTDNSITFADIDNLRWEIVLDSVDGEPYTIKDRNQINRFSYVFLNIVLGLSKK